MSQHLCPKCIGAKEVMVSKHKRGFKMGKKYHEKGLDSVEFEVYHGVTFKTEKAQNDKKRQRRAARDRKRNGF